MTTKQKLPDFTGQRFGRWIAFVRCETPLGKRGVHYHCVCECGNTGVIAGYTLNSGNSLSCGCLVRDTMRSTATTHGQTYSPTWKIWRSMLARCKYPRMDSYKYYGGKGITVCDRWKNSFENFLADMGARPDGMTLDRKDGALNYEPDNCKWSTPAQQAINKSCNIWVEIDGRKQVISHWAKELGIKRTTVIMRMSRGWDPVRALTEPV